MLYLAQSLVLYSDDIRVRCSLRSQLESAGLLKCLEKLRGWHHDQLDRLIRQYEDEAEADRMELSGKQFQAELITAKTLREILPALQDKTKGTKSNDYLMSVLRHLLLIDETGAERDRYFQLIDKLITSIVMSETPDLQQDFSKAFGTPVSRLMSRFVDQDALENARKDNKRLLAEVTRLQRETTDMMDEINSNDIVASLKSQIADLEERLRRSRMATDAVTDQKDNMKRDYESRIADLELIIQELFNMLRESNQLDHVQGIDDGPINRSQLIHDLREQWARKKTIQRLEGRHLKGKNAKGPSAAQQDIDDDDDDEAEVLEAEKVSVNGGKRDKTGAPRSSQFMDAADENVRAHIETALSAQADHIVSST